MYSEVSNVDNGLEDFWNPNSWKEDNHEYRIYADDKEHIFAVVDKDDWEYFSKWLWRAKPSRGGRKFYLYRTRTERSGGTRVDGSAYLHKEIQERKGLKPPTEEHTMADHRDGDSLNCRKKNLRWATPSMNRINQNGAFGYDLIEDERELYEYQRQAHNQKTARRSRAGKGRSRKSR